MTGLSRINEYSHARSTLHNLGPPCLYAKWKWGHLILFNMVVSLSGTFWSCNSVIVFLHLEMEHYSSYRRGDPIFPQIFSSLANLGYNLITLRIVHAENNLLQTLSASFLAFKISPEKSPCCGGICAYWNRQDNLKLCLHSWMISSQAWSPLAVEDERNPPWKPVISLKQEQSGWSRYGFKGSRKG